MSKPRGEGQVILTKSPQDYAVLIRMGVAAGWMAQLELKSLEQEFALMNRLNEGNPTSHRTN